MEKVETLYCLPHLLIGINSVECIEEENVEKIETLYCLPHLLTRINPVECIGEENMEKIEVLLSSSLYKIKIYFNVF